MKNNRFILLLLLALIGAGFIFAFYRVHHPGKHDRPEWLESDSAAAIRSRLMADFSLTPEEALQAVQENGHPEVTAADIDTFIARHYMEAITLDDGSRRIHRKSPRNLLLLNPDMNGGARRRGDHASAARISYADSVINFTRGKNPAGGAHSVTYRFEVSVPYNPSLVGDSLRVWMPVPFLSPRQPEIEIIEASQPDYIVSTPEQSVHSTLYLSAPAPVNPQDTARFWYTARYIASGQYNSPEDIMARLRPYDTEASLYKEYTRFEAPHIIPLDSLARSIVGEETNPWRCSELVYDYIIERYPWAGAREYSTIPCIPAYVVEEGHGDCGQVSLLYISLMRSLGIPARWESGWMIHPGEKNLHDWAEVYFEGVGWVPVDVSFGRYTTSDDPAVINFYSTGLDAHRMATNRGVCGELFPSKRFVRSETVDFQLGEVEAAQSGNLFYPGWDSHLELIDIHPVEK